MWVIISRTGVCLQAIVYERCGCGEKRIEIGHILREGDIVHRLGIPCYHVEEHHMIPNSTEKD